ncbi:MAG: tetratricopeptide repeat protein, partial [Cyanobacteriota bacterium]
IHSCDGVIHLVCDMTGSMDMAPSLAAIAQKYPELASRFPLAEFLQPGGPSMSYTQWEAWLALLHHKPLFIATPKDGTPRDENYVREASQQALQQAHLARLNSVERFAGCTFASQDDLAAEVLRSFVLDLLVQAGLTRRPLTLPFASIGSLFKGRAALIEQLEGASRPVALIGQGGVGKTRLAIEHAWRHLGRCNAVFLIRAGSVEALHRNLAGLCGGNALDLPAQSAIEEAVQRQAVLHWLQANPGWLLIVDNVDTSEAAAEIESLLPQLSGGQVVLTTRLRNWSAAVKGLEVDVLEPGDARDFLLERTADRRRKAGDDITTALEIATDDLGGLALALEQAGAYVSQRRLSLGDYRSQWQSNREAVLRWLDPRLMQYDQSLATTWLTSYQQVDPPARTLLRRLAWFSTEPIPESLLEVELPPKGLIGQFAAIGRSILGKKEAPDWKSALEMLERFSLLNRSSEAPTLSLHRLVQEAARLWQQQRKHPEPNELKSALGWLNGAFVGDPQDVRSWAVLDPLAPHAEAVAGFADASGISEPTARLWSLLGQLQYIKASFGEAEPLMRRALAIDAAHYGPSHPNVAIDLNNLAQLLQATNRLAEAEPLMRSALSIDQASYGPDHPNVARDLNNLAQLLQATNRLAETEPLMRRALAIDEASYGPDHPTVAIRLNNLAQLLHDTNRLAEAEPLYRRALAIDQASYGNDHPNVARHLNNLAQLLQATNRLAEAEPLMRRALAIDEASYGPNHPKVASDLNNLAQLLQATARLAEAEPLMRRTLA